MEEVRRNGSVAARYKYLADGTKLEVSDAMGCGFLYFGSLIYSKRGTIYAPESVGFTGGRIVCTSAGSEVLYHVTDYLGSVRVVADQNGRALEKINYYPFGKRWDAADLPISGNRYLFNGKEWQATGAVNLLDYGARMYDANLGRWFVQDPEYQSSNPYAFCYNNPVRFIDPDGRKIRVWAADKGRYYEWRVVNNKWGFYDSRDQLYDGNDPNILQLDVQLKRLIEGGFNGFMLVIQVAAAEKEISIKFSHKASSFNSKYQIITWMPALFPKNNIIVLTQNGEENYIPFIGLAHELAHALSLIQGTYNDDIWRIEFGKDFKVVARFDEILATHWENKIRAEHNLPLRTHYFYETGDSTLLIDAAGKSLFVDIFDVPYYLPFSQLRFRYKY